jgi:tricorn protease
VRTTVLRFVSTVVLAAFAAPAAALDISDTRMLGQPALSRSHLAFVYAGDIWISDPDGRNVRRLTSDSGLETSPTFSPDGTLVAFSGQYDGNTDVYIVAAAGGTPTRLTWHPGADTVQGFTADGSAVLFTSARAVFTQNYTQLFTVPIKGGLETALPIPNAFRATYAPTGSFIAYNPISPAHVQWKHYRGGTVSTISIYRTSDHAVEHVPQPPGRSNDVDPRWVADTIYFRSDRQGEFNLFAYDTKSKAITQLTRHTDFPVLSVDAAGDRVVYEQAGYLHAYDVKAGGSTRLRIGVAADLVERRPRFVKGPDYARAYDLSPSGMRAAFEYRGEIVTVPAEKGDPRNITNTTGAHERAPAWSPDGKSIAYFSDVSGEYALHVRSQDGKGEPRVISPGGSGFYTRPVWSPDSRRLVYSDNGRSIFVLDLQAQNAKPVKVATEPIYMPGAFLSTRYGWSPDSKWLVYGLHTRAQLEAAHVYSIDQGKSFPLTDGLSDVTEPVFDREGKYLYVLASTNAGPVKDWFAQSNQDMRLTRAIYAVVLAKGTPSPVIRESDEEKGPTPPKTTGAAIESRAVDQDPAQQAGTTKEPVPERKEPVNVVIDFDGVQNRIVDLPIPPGELSNIQFASDGQLYYEAVGADRKTTLQRFDFKKRKSETVLPDIDDYRISADGKKLLHRKGNAWAIAALGAKVDPAEGKLAMDRVEVRIDPPAEWAQMFDEAWRINRDYFYAPNMHGADWPAMKQKYAPFLPHLSHRGDLTRVTQWMLSELGVGHSNIFGGETRQKADTVPGGLLGADYEVAGGRYRIKKVYGGLNWNPQLRSPLTEPGVDVKAGEYLLAVNGQDLRAPASVYSLFENSANRFVEITVGPNPDGSGSRTVSVVPVASESALRNRDWVEGNLRKVTEATKGRVAYVYVPNTAGSGHEYFKRYFFPQANRDAVIVDERFNGGGQVADYYIDILRRPFISYWHTRYGEELQTPLGGIRGPKVMIIDETAGSGGDLLPWMFRRFQLGPLVGKRTWGGLVGILGYPVLMDGGAITAPNLAFWTEEGWSVENEGVAPDIEVEQTPADLIAGRDPQLERAIKTVMEALEKNPPRRPSPPPFPVRVR